MCSFPPYQSTGLSHISYDKQLDDQQSYLFALYKGSCQLVAETSNYERKQKGNKSFQCKNQLLIEILHCSHVNRTLRVHVVAVYVTQTQSSSVEFIHTGTPFFPQAQSAREPQFTNNQFLLFNDLSISRHQLR